MDTITGVLLDVSGSMKRYVDKNATDQRASWSQSIFKVVDNFIDCDVLSKNKLFSICYGGRNEPKTFDLLSTLDNLNERSRGYKKWDFLNLIHKVLQIQLILEENGAPYVRKWASTKQIADDISEDDAELFLTFFDSNEEFRLQFINKSLPKQCREHDFVSDFKKGFANFACSETLEKATKDTIADSIENGHELLKSMNLNINTATVDSKFQNIVMDAKKAYDILHDYIEGVDKPQSNDSETAVECTELECEKWNILSLAQKVEHLLFSLESNGAVLVRTWLPEKELHTFFLNSDMNINLFLAAITTNNWYRDTFIQTCLRNIDMTLRNDDEIEGSMLNDVRVSTSSATSPVKELLSEFASESHSTNLILKLGTLLTPRQGFSSPENKLSPSKCFSKGYQLLDEMCLLPKEQSENNVPKKRESNNVQRCKETPNLSDIEASKLLETVEPYIYGNTPMIEALRQSGTLFSNTLYEDHSKVLLVLSDGLPTDRGELPDFCNMDVYVVCCYVTHDHISNPRRLYSKMNSAWNKGAKFMFDLSSHILTEKLPRTIFVKHGWEIDIENNQTKLFVQINHPEIIDDVCNLAKEVVSCQDSLSDILVSIDLDLYINKANEEFEAKEQVGGTCYANACAAVLHLAMKRIISREGGYPDFFELRDKMIGQFGKNGANTEKVLTETCPQYRLHCREVDIVGAMKAITSKRPVVARFSLSDNEWTKFSHFYECNGKGILKEGDLGAPSGEYVGHAVVLTSFNSECLRFMNSWGTDWGDNGFFRVSKASILHNARFYDIFWYQSDLNPREIQAYKLEGPKIARRLLESLKSLKTTNYSCPLCDVTSPIREFVGDLVRAKCPSCTRSFTIANNDAHILALNMYLMSLCQ